MDRKFMFMEKKLTPGGCLPLPWGYIHVYDHNIQTSTSLKLLLYSNKSQTLSGALLGRGNENLYKRSRSHDQDGCHGYK